MRKVARKVAPVLVLRLALLVAVFACAVLLVQHENAGDPAFCGAGSGCMAVQRSPYSHPGDIPLPLLGLCAHAGLLALSLVAREKAQTYFVAAAALAGGVLGTALLAVQAFKIGSFCIWCTIVDGSAIVAAIAALLVHLEAARDDSYESFLAELAKRRTLIGAWAVGAAILVGMPFLWGEYPVEPPLPAGVAALEVPGKVTIVSFTDFECPYCRKLHPVLDEIRDNWGDRMTLVRKMAPLASHPGAMPAAVAYVCTPEAQRDEMAKRLYAAPEPLLARDGMLLLAREIHLDETAFERCFDGTEARDVVAKDTELFKSVGGSGLPYTFIGSRLVAGFNAEFARKAAQSTMEGDRPSLRISWMIAAAAVVVVSVAAYTLRAASAANAPVLSPARAG